MNSKSSKTLAKPYKYPLKFIETKGWGRWGEKEKKIQEKNINKKHKCRG
jgi:hypothetical protein